MFWYICSLFQKRWETEQIRMCQMHQGLHEQPGQSGIPAGVFLPVLILLIYSLYVVHVLSQTMVITSSVLLLLVSIHCHDLTMEHIYAPEIEDQGGGILFLSCHSVFLLFAKNFNLGYNFWMGSTRALIFHMNILCDNTFHGYKIFFYLWPWPRCLTYLFKTLTLAISFEW
jgi:hypothetical protein